MTDPLPFWAVIKHFKVMESTGPNSLTKALRKGKISYCLLPTKLITPCRLCKIGEDIRKEETLPKTYTRQLTGNSWHSWDSTLLNVIFCNWKRLTVFIGLFILGVLIAIALLYFGLI